jgi:hypothetical protein
VATFGTRTREKCFGEIPTLAQDFFCGYNTEDASRDLRLPSKLTVISLKKIPLIGNASSSREVPFREFIADHFRIAHREAFPHSTFDTSSIDRVDSDAIWEAFREYTETALRAELNQYEWSGHNVRGNFGNGDRFENPFRFRRQCSRVTQDGAGRRGG